MVRVKQFGIQPKAKNDIISAMRKAQMGGRCSPKRNSPLRRFGGGWREGLDIFFVATNDPTATEADPQTPLSGRESFPDTREIHRQIAPPSPVLTAGSIRVSGNASRDWRRFSFISMVSPNDESGHFTENVSGGFALWVTELIQNQKRRPLQGRPLV